MSQIVPLFGAIPGGPEMIVILLVLVLLFGANKIPKLARSSGQAIGEFQKGREQVEQELEEIKDGGSDEEDVAADAGTGADTTTDATVESEVESETTSN